MFGLTRNSSKEDLKAEITSQIMYELEKSVEESDKHTLEQDKLVRKILASSDPTDLQKQITMFDLKKDFMNRMKQAERLKLWHMKHKKDNSELDDEEEEESGGEGQGVPTLDVTGQSEAISTAINKIPLKYRVIADGILKTMTGHGLDDIKKNPALALEMADKFKGLLPQIQPKKKDGAVYTSSSGQQVDIQDPQGYALQ